MAARGLVLVISLALLGAACGGQQPLYHWGEYDSRLYRHYRNPQDRTGWVASMREVVLAAEQGGRKVPPGVYAEYGFALFEAGDHSAAISYFERERDLWPESRVLMDKMIVNAQRQQGNPGGPSPSQRAPAAALEKETR
jgi:hypothetical protein